MTKNIIRYKNKFNSLHELLIDIYNKTPEFIQEDQESLFEFLIEKVENRELGYLNYSSRKTLFQCSAFQNIHETIITVLSSKITDYLSRDEIILDYIQICWMFIYTLENNGSQFWQEALDKYYDFLQTGSFDNKEIDCTANIFNSMFHSLCTNFPDDKEKHNSYSALLSHQQPYVQKHTAWLFLESNFDYQDNKFIDQQILVKYKELVLNFYRLFYNHQHSIVGSHLTPNYITDKELLKDIFINCLPEAIDTDAIFYKNSDFFAISLIAFHQWHQLGFTISELLDLCTEEQRNALFIYILYYFTNNNDIPEYDRKKNIPISRYLIQLNFTYYDFSFIFEVIKPWLKMYLKTASGTHMSFFAKPHVRDIVKEIITTQNDWDNCSQWFTNDYYSLNFIQDEDDVFWNYLTEDQQARIKERNINRENYQKWESLKKQAKTDCIEYFFNKEKMRDEIEYYCRYFSNNNTSEQWSIQQKYQNDMLSNMSLNQPVRVLNPFLLEYLSPEHDYQTTQEECNDILKYWEQYWGFYLYKYITYDIRIEGNKSFPVTFTSEQKEQLTEYINQNINIFSLYLIYSMLDTFNLEYQLSDSQIISLLKHPYYRLNGNFFRDEWMSKGKLYYRDVGSFMMVLESEKINISRILKYSSMSVEELVEKITDLLSQKPLLENDNLFHSLLNIYFNYEQYILNIDNLILQYMSEYINTNDTQRYYFKYLVQEYIVQNFYRMGINVLQLLLTNNRLPYSILEFILTKSIKFQKMILYRSLFLDLKLKVYNQHIEIYNDRNSVNNFNIQDEITALYENKEDINLVEFETQLSNIQDKISQHKNTDIICELLNYNTLTFIYYIDNDINLFNKICESIKQKNIRNCDIIIKELHSYISEGINIQWDDIFKILMNYQNNFNPQNIDNDYFINSNNFFYKILKLLIDQDKLSHNQYSELLEIKDSIHISLHHIIKSNSDSFLLPVMIKKCSSNFQVFHSGNDEIIQEFQQIDDLIKYLNTKTNYLDKNISRICDFQYLIEDIIHKQMTFTHPFCFEDPLENQWSLVENPIFISCWSFDQKEYNSYAWWKIYGDKNKVRIEISAITIIKNIVSQLFDGDELYVGSISYDEIKREHHETIWEYFEKRTDFSFEQEVRIIINSKKNDPNKIIYNKGLPTYYKFSVDKKLYKTVILNPEGKYDFHPYYSISDKDKKGMAEVLKSTINQNKNTPQN